MLDLLRGFSSALRTITIIPFFGKDTSDFATSLYWFPVIGIILGGLIYTPLYYYQQFIGNFWPELCAFIIIAYSIFITRGFHLDGVADWADGFWGGHTRERVLEIMKDSLLGTFGVLALISLILFKWILLVKIVEMDLILFLVASFTISRCCQVELATTYSYARSNGTAASIVKNSNCTHRLVGLLLGAAICFVIYQTNGLILLALGFIFTHIFAYWCKKRINGITGDLIGACSELTELVVLSAAIVLQSF